MLKNGDKLGPIAVIGGAVDLIVSGIVPFIWLAKMANQDLGENSKRLAAAMSEVSSITRLLGFGIPLLAAVLVVVGVGILQNTPWAPKAALIWSCSALAFLVGSVALHVVIVWPHIEAARQAAIQSGATENALMGYDAVKFGMIRMALIRLPFPIILLTKLGSV